MHCDNANIGVFRIPETTYLRRMQRRILIIVGHPSKTSFNSALAERYADSARDAGALVRLLHLGDLDFDPVLREGYSQQLEPDLEEAQRHIEWCEHLVVVTPLWWGTVPALLKGFFDRAFLPNWAFKYEGKMPVKLLTGRSAQAICTMDSPNWWYRWVQRKSLERTLGTATLRFVGFKTRFRILPSVRESSDKLRARWLEEMAALGAKQVRA